MLELLTVGLGGPPKPDSDVASADATPTSTPNTSRPGTPQTGHLLSAKPARGGGVSRRARKAAANKTTSSADESKKKDKPAKAKSKGMRKWDADGLANDDDEDEKVLDYSTANTNGTEEGGPGSGPVYSGLEDVDASASGMRNRKGQYVLKDLGDEVHSILKGANEKKAQPTSSKGGAIGAGFGAISGLFRNVIGGKTLTKEDLEKPMKGMEEHLLKKNVAREAAVRLCEGVERELIGHKTGSFECIHPFPLHYPSISRF